MERGGTVTIEFFVPGEPQGKARARTYLPKGSKKYRSVTPDKTRMYEVLIRNAFLRAWKNKEMPFPKDRPVRICVTAYYTPAASTSKRKLAQMQAGLLLPLKKPDLDNVIKAVCDALNKYAYHDDAQIVSITCSKAFGTLPGLSVILMDNADYAVRSAQPES
jgi:Holliday junction resolvase RusA-like endonuclease